MRKFQRIVACSIALLVVALYFSSALAEPLSRHHVQIDWGKRLERRGYELSEAGLRDALSNREDYLVAVAAARYAEDLKIKALLPDVKAYLEFLEEYESAGEGSRLSFVRCVMALDDEMTAETLDGYVKRIRRLLYDVKEGDKDYGGTPTGAYFALLAAQKYKSVDIYDDLLYLAATDILKGGDFPSDTRMLFELYGDRVSEADIDMLLDAYHDRPERQAFILRRAREHGKRLEEEK